MQISELIKTLERIRSEVGDVSVVVSEYSGGDCELFDVAVKVQTDDSRAMPKQSPFVLIEGCGRF